MAEIKDIGMTNSGRFFDRKTNKFDIEKAFSEECHRINSAKEDLRFLLDNPNNYTEDEMKEHALNLASEFFTLLKVARSWEKK